jgi:hypothetical protein
MRTLAAVALVLSITACGGEQTPEARLTANARSEREYQKIMNAVVKATCAGTLEQRADGVNDVAYVTKDLDAGDSDNGLDVPQEVYELAEEIKKNGCPSLPGE